MSCEKLSTPTNWDNWDSDPPNIPREKMEYGNMLYISIFTLAAAARKVSTPRLALRARRL